MDYIDFQLKIGPRVAENQYAVSARSQAIGETSGTFVQPLTDEQLELFVLRVGLARRSVRRIHSPEWRAAQDFGQKLFRSLFTDEIRAAYLASHNDAVRQEKGLRIKLTLDAPELANYPWEFLFDPSSGQFLSLFEDTPIIRYIELPRPISPLRVSPPLRILAVASSPKDYEPLDLARERRNLAQALESLTQTGTIELDWLPTATLDAVREQLLKRTYHIFHFIGHGGFDTNQEDGILIFENAGGFANRVSGERLAVILGNHRTLRVVVLNACEGARTSEQDPFAGAAMTLVRTGNLPAVIAMQFEITDRAAIDFASGFYSALAACRPVDAAMSQGRQAIFAADNDVEWSTPVLYLRAADGVIFQIDPNAETAQAQENAKAQADQERAAREKAAVEYATVVLAEQERVETERRKQERLAQEKSDSEGAAAEKALEGAQPVPPQTRDAKSESTPSARPSTVPEPKAASKTIAPIAAAVSAPVRDDTAAPSPRAARGLSARSQVKLVLLSGISFAAASALTTGSAYALSFASEEQPRVQLLAILLAIGALLLGTFAAWVFGAAISRVADCNRASRWILVCGILVTTLSRLGPVVNQGDAILLFVVLGLVTGAYVALALWTSNRGLAGKTLGIIGGGWVIGFVLQGIAAVGLYPSLLDSVWEWLLPLQEISGDKPLFVLQLTLVGFFVGSLAPLVGLAVTFQQLRPLPKKQ